MVQESQLSGDLVRRHVLRLPSDQTDCVQHPTFSVYLSDRLPMLGEQVELLVAACLLLRRRVSVPLAPCCERRLAIPPEVPSLVGLAVDNGSHILEVIHVEAPFQD